MSDKEKQEVFVKPYKRRSEDENGYFMDGSHPTFKNYLGYGWIRKGRRFEIKSEDGRKRIILNPLRGSFNPVLIGHLVLADTVLSTLRYDRIILISTYQTPFKQGAVGGSPQDRLDMLAASIPGDPRLTIDDCEIKRKGVSYH